MKKKIRILILTMLMALFVGSIVVQAESSFFINVKKATVNIGDDNNKLLLEIKNLPSDKKTKWTSWNENIAKVDQEGETGVVTALRKGKAIISSGVGFPRETCVVTVVEPSMKLNKTSAVIYSGTNSTSVQLKTQVKGADKNVVWKSSDETIATVDVNGLVKAKGAGTAVVTAAANGQTSSCNITVLNSTISLNINEMQLSVKGTGSSVKLVPEIVGASKKVIWNSSDPTVAKVKNGKVTGKKDGTTVITAEANGVKTSCAVTVVDGISINEEQARLYITGSSAETKRLKTNASKKDTVAWSSSDTEVATVDNQGVISAKKAGTAIIAASCDGKTDTCKVEVVNSALTIAEETVYLETKGTAKNYTLDYNVIGRKNTVKWKSSNKKVAEVSKGKIKAKKIGTATITAEANGVKASVNVVVQEYKPSIVLNQKEYTLYTVGKGNTITLKAAVNGNNKKVTWKSSNADIAEVSAKGKVTAKKEGSVLITATANGVSDECLISVRETKVTLEEEYLLLSKGEKKTLGVDIIGQSQSATYTTANSKVATVKDGVVTAKNYGETDIKVKANNVTAVCHVVVSDCDQHDWKRADQYDKEPTCVDRGLVTYECSKCGGKKQETVEPLGHSFGEWIVETSATETTAGLEKQVCSRCGMENTRRIPPTGSTGGNVEDEVNSYKLVWEENFNGNDGDRVNEADWNYEVHEPGWVNAELQAYVDDAQNAYIENNQLHIKAIKEVIDGKEYYTSGRVNTQGKHDFTYGRFEVSAKVPAGKGFLPAFWMMPTDESYYGQWPKCGELDIMEVLGSDTSTAYGTLHFGEPHTQTQGSYTLSGDDSFADSFHVFACEWDPGEIRFYVDDVCYYKVNDWFTKKEGFGEVAYPAPYDQPFYIILNLAVGGSWVGYPDDTTVFGDNSQFIIDYVRVYQKDHYDTNVDKPVTEVVFREPDTTGNYIINGDFAIAEDLTDENANWKLLTAEGGKAEAEISDNTLHIMTTQPGTVSYGVQIVQEGLPMIQGTQYKLSYDAYADEARTMITDISAPEKGWGRYLNDTTVDLTTTKQKYEHEFEITGESDAKGRLEFNLGNQGSTATVHISNVRLEKTGEVEIKEDEKTVRPDGNYVYNGQFDEGNEPGKRRLDYWDWDVSQCNGASVSVTDDSKRELKVTVPETVTSLEQVVVYQDPIAITGGKQFILSFDAYADRAKTIQTTIAGRTFDCDLTTERASYRYELETPEDLKGSELRFLLGTAGTTYIDNVRIQEAGLLVNGDFSSGMIGYEVYVNEAAKVQNYVVDEMNEDHAFSIDIVDTGDQDWYIQLKQNNITLEKDKWYKLAFDAKSTTDREIMYALQRDGTNDDDWTPYSGSPKAELTSEYQNFATVFKMDYDTNPNVILSISMGAVSGKQVSEYHTVVIDNITLEETEPQEIETPGVGVELIKNGDFAAKDEYWESYVGNGGEATVGFEREKAVYTITNVGDEDYSVQLKQAGLTLEKGASYQVKMKIKSTEARTVKYAFLDQTYNWYGGEDLSLTADEVKEVDYQLDVKENTSDKITFNISMGKIANENTPASTIEIDDISVVKISGGTDEPEKPAKPVDPVEVGTELIKNGDFAAGDENWENEVIAPGEAKVSFDEKAVYEITNVGTDDWNIKLKYKELLTLEKGASYQIKMKIKSSAARTVKYSLMTPDYDWYGGEDLVLEADKEKAVDYTLSVEDKDSSDEITFAISMGKIANENTPASTIEIDDISIVKISGESAEPEQPEESVEIGTDLIKNGNFEDGKENWNDYVDSAAEANRSFTDKKARYEIMNAGTADWNVQLKQEGLNMEKDASYKVNFKIASSIDRDIRLALMGAGDAWCGGTDIHLKKNKLQSFSQIVTLNGNYTSGTIAFQISMGQLGETDLEAHAIEIFDISLTKVEEGTEADKVTEEDYTVEPPKTSGDEQEPDSEEPETSTENLIKNGNFEDGKENWNDYYADSAAEVNRSFTDKKARYEIMNAGTADWNVQLKQEGLNMEKDARYKVNFKIASSIDRDIKLAFMGDGDAWYGGADIQLTKNKLQSFSQIVTLENYTSGTVAFQISMGQLGETDLEAHAIEIFDISLTKVEEDAKADEVTEEDYTVEPPKSSENESQTDEETSEDLITSDDPVDSSDNETDYDDETETDEETETTIASSEDSETETTEESDEETESETDENSQEDTEQELTEQIEENSEDTESEVQEELVEEEESISEEETE